jgi:hypothetical protein
VTDEFKYEYVVSGNHGHWGEPYYNLNAIKEDRDWAQENNPHDRFVIKRRKVGSWEDTNE